MKEEHKLECPYCKRNDEETIIRGSNKDDVNNLMDIHMNKCHGSSRLIQKTKQ